MSLIITDDPIPTPPPLQPLKIVFEPTTEGAGFRMKLEGDYPRFELPADQLKPHEFWGLQGFKACVQVLTMAGVIKPQPDTRVKMTMDLSGKET